MSDVAGGAPRLGIASPAVVGGEDHECLVELARLLQTRDETSDHVVETLEISLVVLDGAKHPIVFDVLGLAPLDLDAMPHGSVGLKDERRVR